MYDLIGDVHGHADELTALLSKLGYSKKGGAYWHPERKVIFVGDFVDRGPKIGQVLETVYPMLQEGNALAVMGNHELNALAYHTEHPEKPGEYLRPRTESNMRQHQATVSQLGSEELKFHLQWIRKLPLWLDLPSLRVIHACWDPGALATVANGLTQHGEIQEEFLKSACTPGGPLYAPVEILLKGKEGALPEGLKFLDADGHSRSAVRTRWYLPTEGQTYRTYAFQTDPIDCDFPLTDAVVTQATPYPAECKPVFFGH